MFYELVSLRKLLCVGFELRSSRSYLVNSLSYCNKVWRVRQTARRWRLLILAEHPCRLDFRYYEDTSQYVVRHRSNIMHGQLKYKRFFMKICSKNCNTYRQNVKILSTEWLAQIKSKLLYLWNCIPLFVVVNLLHSETLFHQTLFC